MKTSTFALLAGIAYLGAGLLGLVPAMLTSPPADAPPTSFGLLYGYLLGLFPVNIVNTGVHLLIGGWGIAAWRGLSSPVLFARSIAMLCGVLAVMGMIPLLNTVFGWIPIHGNDIWLYAATATVAAYFGWRDEIVHDERRGERNDRRHGMQPVMQERRSGFPDRRLEHGI